MLDPALLYCWGCVTCFVMGLMEKPREEQERAMLVLACLQTHFAHPAACPHPWEDVHAGRASPHGSANILASSLPRV